jgi:hypothetical protein
MKRTQLITIIALISCNFSFSQEVNSQKEIGDDLDLYAVLDAFKDAESIEDFEKTLNGEDSKINNLDLDEDGEIDYIQVNDEGEGDAHAFILSIAISEDETQDIAVIELEKSNDNDATIQIIGDQELYGTDYILEPKNPDEPHQYQCMGMERCQSCVCTRLQQMAFDFTLESSPKMVETLETCQVGCI